MFRGLISDLAAIPFGMAVVIIAVGLVRVPASGRAAPAELVASLGLALEYLLGAGLLRLSAAHELKPHAVVAAIVALRRVLTRGLGYGLRALDSDKAVALRA